MCEFIIAFLRDPQWIINLFIALVGAFFGAKLGISFSMDREQEKELDLAKQKMEYFSLLLNDISKNLHEQSGDIEQLIGEVKRQPYEWHLLSMVASHDLTRAQDISKVEIFSPLVLVFGNEGKGLYGEFRSRLDFLDLIYIQLEEINEKHLGFMVKDQTLVSDGISRVISMLTSRQDRVLKNGEEYMIIEQLLHISDQLYEEGVRQRKSNFAQFESVFFQRHLRDYISMGFDPLLNRELTELSITTLNLLNKIKNNSEAFTEDCQEIIRGFRTALPLLEDSNRKIRDRLNLADATKGSGIA